MRKLNIGFVGSGFVGQLAHINNYVYNQNVNIVGLAELRPELGKQVCSKYGIKNYYKNHFELMNSNNDIDGIIAIVNRKHTAKVAKDILSRGYNLFTEKPMAATYKEAKKLIDIAKKKKCIYVIGNMRRHDEGVKIAKKYFNQFIKDNKIGKIISFRSFCYAGGDYCNIDGDITTNEKRPNNQISPMAPNWIPRSKHKEFEKFLNYFIHDINLIRFFFGNKLKVVSANLNRSSSNILFESNKIQGHFHGVYINQNKWEEGFEIIFERGMIKISLPPAFLRNQPAKVKIYKEGNDLLTISPKTDWTWAFKRQTENFIKILRQNKQSISSGQDSINDMLIIEKIWKLIV